MMKALLVFALVAAATAAPPAAPAPKVGPAAAPIPAGPLSREERQFLFNPFHTVFVPKVVAAEPEEKPVVDEKALKYALPFYHHGFPTVYHHVAAPVPAVYHTPFVYHGTCINSLGYHVPCALPNAVAPAVEEVAEEAPVEEEAILNVEKRDAEAEPEADPALFYTSPYYSGYGYGGYSPYYAPYAAYRGYYGHPLVAYAHAAGCRNNLGALVPCNLSG